MLVKSFETALYDKLRSFFGQNGFVLMADKKQFRKVTPRGFQNVIFTATSYDDEIWLEVNFGIRNNQIEQIAQQYLGNTRDFWGESNTIVVSIGKYNDAKYFRYKIMTEPDIEDVCDIVKDFLFLEGFPFLKATDNLLSLNEIFNKFPKKPCKFVYNQVHRSFKGIINAKLIHDENFLDLTDKHRENLIRIGATPEELLTFERLLSFLLYHSPN
ncbi:MAG: hypothetical protein RLZZ306_3317 [Bacteroidota bacterium]|jgi:hypothetical protein